MYVYYTYVTLINKDYNVKLNRLSIEIKVFMFAYTENTTLCDLRYKLAIDTSVCTFTRHSNDPYTKALDSLDTIH